MGNILFFILFTILCFGILIIAIKLFPKDSIFTIAIGSAIGSNIYNSVSYPIDIYGIIFGIDSIVYTIFVFCLLLMYINYGKKDFKLVMYTTMFSIFFTAFLYFMGTWIVHGYSTDLLFVTMSYFNSIIGTYLAMLSMVWVYDKLRAKNVNIYLCIFIALLVASIINSAIYFSLTILLTRRVLAGFWMSLAGSYIGKLIASSSCLLVYLFQKKEREKREKTHNDVIIEEITNEQDVDNKVEENSKENI